MTLVRDIVLKQKLGLHKYHWHAASQEFNALFQHQIAQQTAYMQIPDAVKNVNYIHFFKHIFLLMNPQVYISFPPISFG
jgi:hypothetical protein